jgi:pimeloyl-ACP methyl ester carboxylesterase
MVSRARARIVTAVATAAPAAAVAAAGFVIQQAARGAGWLARRGPGWPLAGPLTNGPDGPGRASPLAPVPPWLPPGRVVGLPGRGEVFARDSGGAPGDPAVLLLHGWTASADLNFFPVYAGLAGSYRVIAMDHRGHGRGMRSIEPFSLEDCADDAAALLDELGAGQVIVVGYSMGGPIGLLLARRHPGRVAGLVMQATALEWYHSAHERRAWRLLPVLELGLRLGTGAGFVERVLRHAIRQAPELDTYRPWLAAEFRRGLARELTDAGHALSRYDAEPWAAQLGLPTAVLITTRDRLVRPAKQRELAAALRAEVLEVEADHDLPIVKGTEFARLTMRAVGTVAAAAGIAARTRVPRPGRRRGSTRDPA